MGRLRDCGRRGVLPGGSVRIRASGTGEDRRAGFSGVETCGSVWACPVCSVKVLAHRQAELSDGIAAWVAGGNSVVMVTLTMRHRKGQKLAKLWDGVSLAWDRVVKGRPYRRVRDAFGIAGYVRVVEVTSGDNGWHVHLHVGLFLVGETSSVAAEAIESAMFSPWRASLVAQGFGAPTRSAGIDVKLWKADGPGVLGEYFTKQSYDAGDGANQAAMELARGDLKQARSGNRTPFQVLSAFQEWGDADDLDLWTEWEKASHGRRQMTWSRGMRELLQLGVEKSDEQVAAEETGTEDDDLVELPAAAYRFVAREGLLGLVLDLAEDDDDGTILRRWLTARGVEFADCRRDRLAAVR
jgi:hypothetical protein